MSLPETISAYPDCKELYERANEDPIGVRARMESEAAAKLFQMRMHQYRSLERRQSKRLYDRDDIRHGKSEFDPLVVKVREDTEGHWWVYVERANLE